MENSHLIKQFLQYQREFMAYLMAMTRDLEVAEEVFQNAAVVVMERSDDNQSIRDFRAWAKEVVRRQALSYLRKQGTRVRRLRPIEPQLLDQIVSVFMTDQTDIAHQTKELAALRECVRKVSRPQQEMLALRYQRQASFGEIGRVVGKTENAVQRALSRLRRQLHSCVRHRLVIADGGTR